MNVYTISDLSSNYGCLLFCRFLLYGYTLDSSTQYRGETFTFWVSTLTLVVSLSTKFLKPKLAELIFILNFLYFSARTLSPFDGSENNEDVNAAMTEIITNIFFMIIPFSAHLISFYQGSLYFQGTPAHAKTAINTKNVH